MPRCVAFVSFVLVATELDFHAIGRAYPLTVIDYDRLLVIKSSELR